ncbi:MAG: hypothetical protein M0Q44_17015 [Methylobacter sp.]|jgi:hypothetical protein|nr:hypothetical protein [Methylobacter sp.]
MNKDNFLGLIITAINQLIASTVVGQAMAIECGNEPRQAFQRLPIKVPNREVVSGDEL